VLDEFGVRGDTKAALFDLYIALGNDVLEVFAEMAAGASTPGSLAPEDIACIRESVVVRYLERNHPRWVGGLPTPSLWHPRLMQGRASGMAVPLGEIGPDAADDDFIASVERTVRRVLGAGQPVPEGIVILGRNAHFGGRQETISFDVAADELGDAIALGRAVGQQHTIPGSVGETSGTIDTQRSIALIWEVQPNVLKPGGGRNQPIAKIYRKHRNWHVVTLAAALRWLLDRGFDVWILRGEALAAAHEVNHHKPVTPMIVELHNRTVTAVADAMHVALEETSSEQLDLLLETEVMNTGLRKHALENGAASAMWHIVRGESARIQ
jgi:hypothetical protein